MVGWRRIFASDLVAQLRKLRRNRGSTKVYMAEPSEWTADSTRIWRTGKKEICIRNLELIAAAFDMTIYQLMSRI